MPCPDDNVLAEFMQGLLSVDRRRELEGHLDTCPSCASLVVGVGRTFDRGEDLPSASKIGRYEIVECIGRGAMGTVYAARDPLLARNVALKVLHHATEARDRTLHEARALARLSHPNVVSIHDVGEDEGRLYLAMEIVEGTTLAAWLRAERRSWDAIVEVFAQAAKGLAAAHTAGVVHGDFKPDNVIVGITGSVCVTDFGLARLFTADGAPPSERHAIAGTPAYMAPEILAGERATPASDQFAFCTAFYEALYGKRPIDAKSVDELREAFRAGRTIASPLDMRGAPDWLFSIVRRGLERSPSERHASMDVLSRHIAQKLGGHVQYVVNGVVQVVMLIPHIAITVLFIWAFTSPDTPESKVASEDAHHYAISQVLAYWLGSLFFFGWAPLGVAWASLNAYGLFRKRRWAITSTLIYALFSLPTCLGTPAALYAIATLWPLRKKRRDFA